PDVFCVESPTGRLAQFFAVFKLHGESVRAYWRLAVPHSCMIVEIKLARYRQRTSLNPINFPRFVERLPDRFDTFGLDCLQLVDSGQPSGPIHKPLSQLLAFDVHGIRRGKHIQSWYATGSE